MWNFLTFRRMMVPVIIQVVFWAGTIACVVVGFLAVSGRVGVFYQTGTSTGRLVSALTWIFLGPFILRIYCETMIVFYRINDTLTDIRNNTMRSKR